MAKLNENICFIIFLYLFFVTCNAKLFYVAGLQPKFKLYTKNIYTHNPHILSVIQFLKYLYFNIQFEPFRKTRKKLFKCDHQTNTQLNEETHHIRSLKIPM